MTQPWKSPQLNQKKKKIVVCLSIFWILSKTDESFSSHRTHTFVQLKPYNILLELNVRGQPQIPPNENKKISTSTFFFCLTISILFIFKFHPVKQSNLSYLYTIHTGFDTKIKADTNEKSGVRCREERITSHIEINNDRYYVYTFKAR